MATVNIPGNNMKMPNFNALSRMAVPFVLVGLVFVAVISGFYSVPTDSVGLVQRFGKYIRTTGPGLHFKIPLGIETVRRVRDKYSFKEEFGFRTKKAGVRTQYYEPREYERESGSFGRLSKYMQQTGISGQNVFLAESLMLTGNLNAAEVQWVVQYKIKDPVSYAFNVRNIEETIRNMAEAVMRQAVGDATVDEVITYGKDRIQAQCEEQLQLLLDELQSGILITKVVFQDVDPPQEVKNSFNEVNEARQDKERFINEAWQEYNRAIPRAEGEALQLIQEAEGYRMRRVNTAQGDAERFLATWQEYKDAKDVTRRRLYIETLTSVLPKLNKKIIVDSDEKGVLPLLNLTGEMNPKGGN
jgi:modulator of FtsH protease HflK